MAIITFWNDNIGKSGQTHSALAIASYMAIERNFKILLMSTKHNDQVILQAFGMNTRDNTIKKLTKNKQAMDLESGMEGMAKLAAASRLSPDMVPNYTQIIYKNRLEIVAAPSGKEDFEYERVYGACKDILNVARKYYDIVIIDLNNGKEDEKTKELIRMSDVVILNMEQKPSEFEKIVEIQNDTELFKPKNLLKLINNYDRKSKYNTKNVTRTIGEKKEILSVPYCNLFSESVQEGTAAEFFLSTRVKRLDGNEDRTSFFVHEIQRDVEAIIYKLQELQMRI